MKPAPTIPSLDAFEEKAAPMDVTETAYAAARGIESKPKAAEEMTPAMRESLVRAQAEARHRIFSRTH